MQHELEREIAADVEVDLEAEPFLEAKGYQ